MRNKQSEDNLDLSKLLRKTKSFATEKSDNSGWCSEFEWEDPLGKTHTIRVLWGEFLSIRRNIKYRRYILEELYRGGLFCPVDGKAILKYMDEEMGYGD